jgi:hypothetical protein
VTINRDAVLFIAYALASAALTVCSTHGWISDADQLAIEGVLTAFATAFHIPNARAAAAIKAQEATPSVSPTVTVVAQPADVTPSLDDTSAYFAAHPRGDTA